MRRLFGAFRAGARPAEKMGAQPIVTAPLTCPSLAATPIMAAIDDINRDFAAPAWTYRLKEAA